MKVIDGVTMRTLLSKPDERGFLIELLRSDWDVYAGFGQVYLTTVYPDVVKAWHYHKGQTDNFACIKGMIKVALYDGRKESPTYKLVNEVYIGEKNLVLIKIPPLVYHGFKAIGEETAYIINILNRIYNYDRPDEYRLPPDTTEIPYDWILSPGKKHG